MAGCSRRVETLEELRGKVVVVEFWTFGCYNCKNRIPYTQEMYAKYRDQGMEIVGIHSPSSNTKKTWTTSRKP